MSDARQLTDYAIAIRMSCSNAELTGAQPRSPALVAADDSAAALALAADAATLRQRASALRQGQPISAPAGLSPADLSTIVAETIKREGAMPPVVAVPGIGLFFTGRNGPDCRRTQTAIVAGKAVPAAAPAAPDSRLSGCVAVVTGGAQGFGKGLSEEIARAGACLAVADLNDPLGTSVAASLNEMCGEGTAAYVHMDVTSLPSIEAALAQVVRAFGGVDIFVANAGVLKAGPVDELTEREFDLQTSVNYKGFFLCAKAVVPIMKRQHAVNPRHTMDIIQINSKSGLVGSSRNSAYAGSKFGAIGLTQSFALELIPHNIKVNAICPGNYYEGPLWSDPKTGLFVQYLNAGKVPGARNVDDVRKFYMAKSPIPRGCTPRDVARAIFYAHEQEYETGQAIPVTGGQVMLS
jgi:sorbitol-6-phosphate 2-dehydrogenase